jgi:enediyne biosynthesis protein CalE5
VVGCDQDGQALETARERARAQGLDNVEFRQCSFEHLGLEDASAAAAVSRFGLLMFGDGETGARELARVLAPGAPFALAMWTAPDDNPAIRLGLRTLERVQDSLGSGPAVPALSRSLASASTITSWLANAGMRRVETTRFEWGAEFPDVDAACDYLQESGGPLKGFYAALPARPRGVAVQVTNPRRPRADRGMGRALPQNLILPSGCMNLCSHHPAAADIPAA